MSEMIVNYSQYFCPFVSRMTLNFSIAEGDEPVGEKNT